MSEAATQAAEATDRPAEIRGLVDNATPQHLHGWAWNAARPDERVTVELRLGEQVMATAVAEQERADLAPAGIGDGRHAFSLPMKKEWLRQSADIAVVARAADGAETPLAIRVRRSEQDQDAAVQRALEALARAQRELGREVERLGSRLPSDGARLDAQLAALAAGQAALGETLQVLTVWLNRIDQHLAAAATAAPRESRTRRVDAWQLVLGGVLAAVVVGAGLVTALLLRGPG